MIDLDFPRDLLTIAVVFGAATIVWAGWAQERPPSTSARIGLGGLSALGLALLGFGIPAMIRAWDGGTAIEPGTSAFTVYVVVFWLEVIVGVVGAILLIRRKRSELVAPLILVIVGVHFIPLAWVFGQGILLLAAVLLVAAAAAAIALRGRAAPSFWCGVLAAPVFVVLGAWSLLTGLGAAA
jgi:hypothetical protein